jgi:hypothetical protein
MPMTALKSITKIKDGTVVEYSWHYLPQCKVNNPVLVGVLSKQMATAEDEGHCTKKIFYSAK